MLYQITRLFIISATLASSAIAQTQTGSPTPSKTPDQLYCQAYSDMRAGHYQAANQACSEAKKGAPQHSLIQTCLEKSGLLIEKNILGCPSAKEYELPLSSCGIGAAPLAGLCKSPALSASASSFEEATDNISKALWSEAVTALEKIGEKSLTVELYLAACRFEMTATMADGWDNDIEGLKHLRIILQSHSVAPENMLIQDAARQDLAPVGRRFSRLDVAVPEPVRVTIDGSNALMLDQLSDHPAILVLDPDGNTAGGGTTPMEFEIWLPPDGKQHTVELRNASRGRAVGSFEGKPGQSLKWTARLDDSPHDPAAGSTPFGKRTLGIAGVAVGVGAVAWGLVNLNQRQHAASEYNDLVLSWRSSGGSAGCPGSGAPQSPTCQGKLDAAERWQVGAGLLAGGVVVSALGGYFLWTGDSPPPNTAFTCAVSPRVFTCSGQF